jgi:hypothetical protein
MLILKSLLKQATIHHRSGLGKIALAYYRSLRGHFASHEVIADFFDRGR